ncbi:unnamed protein product [Prunus armeniaca]|uniref:non-specific serine/threonine protein kinase n=1 Tax=Prunus armeniaca TaxID=36596 RepID=A0A6J5WXL7_PRUAR|nr:unnamed protein product [Prunus armeniaca]
MDTKTNPMLVFIVVLLCLFLESRISFAADTINANQSLSGDQTIVSGDFELGFFEFDGRHYIGTWYSGRVVSANTIVWVANREIPISDRFSSVLNISDGNLVLFNEAKTPVWSTHLSSTTTPASVQAVLLDSGNLVLRAHSSSSEFLWQSFDHPTHTWLPGAKLGFNNITNQTQILTSWKNSRDPAPGLYSFKLDRSNSYILLWNRSKQYWTSGSWNASSNIFSLLPYMRHNYVYNYSFVSNENGSYLTYSLYDPKKVSPTMMPVSGQIQQLIWYTPSRPWKIFWSEPRQQCAVYAICGPFGSCNEKSGVLCNCLMGFEQKSPQDWALQDYSGGCQRKTNLQCGNSTSVIGTKDQFLEMHSMSMPENELHVKVGSAKKCESICLNNCSCTAYAYESSNACSIWIGDLLGVQELVADDAGGRTLYIRLAASELMYLKNGKGDADKRPFIIAMVLAAAELLMIIFCYFLWKKRLGKRRMQRRKYGVTKINYGAGGGKNDTELPIFGLKSILNATNNFSEANKLGEGGFGPVYKGILPENQEVAIKRLSKKSGQGREEFINELNLMAKLQHTNLVRLLGCCIEEEELILIYEFMPNRSLDKLLFDPSENAELDWGKRFRIIEGIAQGVLYIHKYSRLKIIHRDLKASNVLLDGAMNPKISDFGMAKIFEINQTEANTNRVVGTYGYMSPEYARYGHFSDKLDVFSFGVLLLEIVSGKRNAAFYHFEHSPTLAGWAWELWREGRGMEVIDASVRETCPTDEALKCIHVGFLCVQEAPADRPTMASVIRMLQSNDATSLPPSKEPAFSTNRNSIPVVGSSQLPAVFSNNGVTISLPEGDLGLASSAVQGAYVFSPPLGRMKLPDHSIQLGNKSTSECESECHQNCSCTAYAYVNATEENTRRCLTWFGDLMDLVANHTLGETIYIRLHSSNQDDKSHADNFLKQRSNVIAIVSGTVGFLTITFGYLLWKKTLRSEGSIGGKMSETISNISAGGGTPKLINWEREDLALFIRMSRKSGQGHQEFMNELKLIAKLKHTNLVRLLGCCVEEKEMILIYEYIKIEVWTNICLVRSSKSISPFAKRNRSHVWSKVSTYAELLEGSSTWEGTISKHKTPENQRILTCKLPGKEALFEPAYIPQFLPPSDLAIEKRRKERKKMAGNGNHLLEQPRERGLELSNFLILCEQTDEISPR